jgi:DNA-binding protein HU-beta
MTKTETVRELAERAGVDRKQASAVLDELAKLSYEQARDGFTIPGLGKLVLVDRKARMGRNPATGEQIQIPAKRVLKFRIAKQAKDAVLAAKGGKRK